MKAKKALSLYRKFYSTWVRCESTRGCYSCCEYHDSRCPASHLETCSEKTKCVCGRKDLEDLEQQINALETLERMEE